MKLLLIISMLITSVKAQFIGLGVGNTLNATIGYLSDDFYTINAQFDLPYSSEDKAKIFSLNGGKQFYISNLSITPTIGAGYLKYKDFSEYDQGGQIKEVELTKIVWGLEVGRDFNYSRVSIQTRYIDKFYYSLGIKYFL